MLTHIRIDKKLDEAIESVLPDTYFKNKSEFIRDAIRKSLEEYKVQRRIYELKGSSKGHVPTREERVKAFSEFEKEIRDSQDR